ncbi:MAG TPA: DUF3238 domain-containing protein [Cellvibrio sp.]
MTVSGFPKWYVAIRSGASAALRNTLPVTASNLKIAVGGISFKDNAFALASKSTVFSLHVDGRNPLIALAPAINADLNLYLKRVGSALSCLVSGDHDGFPAYELYINGVRVYCYDPIARGAGPAALFPPSDIMVNTGWINIDLGTGQIVAGQICGSSISTAQPSTVSR